MKTIEVKTQKDLDAIPDAFEGEINITGTVECLNRYFKNALVYIYGNAQVRSVSGNAQVSGVSGNAQVSNVSGNAQVNNVSGNAQVSYVYDKAQVRYVYDKAQVRYVYGNAQVRYVYDKAQVSSVYGNAQVSNVYGNAQVETLGRNIVSVYKNAMGVKLKLSKKTKVVKIDNSVKDVQDFCEMYPVKKEGKRLILYKAVHKIGKRYFADHGSADGNNREYKIGEKSKGKLLNDKSNSCAPGLHVSHKNWAVIYGFGWPDLAILEVSVPINKILVAKDCDGKVRTSEFTVLRELDKNEY